MTGESPHQYDSSMTAPQYHRAEITILANLCEPKRLTQRALGVAVCVDDVVECISSDNRIVIYRQNRLKEQDYHRERLPQSGRLSREHDRAPPRCQRGRSFSL